MDRRTRRNPRGVWLILLALLLGMGASLLVAQTSTTGPVSTAWKVVWNSSNGASAAAAQALEARFTVDTNPYVVLTSNKSCTTTPTAGLFACQANLTQPLVDQLNKIGTHDMVLKEYDPATKLEGPNSLPFVLLSPPAAPTGLRLTP